MHRRDFLERTAAVGLLTLGGCATRKPDVPVLEVLARTVGRRETAAGIVTAMVDGHGTRLATHGSSGIADVPMDSDTIFEIGSITKVFTAILLADMVERREVTLEDPVAKWLPPSATPKVTGRPITLADLASYNSGLPRMPSNMPPGWNTSPQPLAGYTADMLHEFVGNHTPQYAPGTHYEYSNLAFGLLGDVIARRVGKSFEDIVVERICEPLGLHNTRITLTPAMQKRVTQGHDLGMVKVPMLEMPGLQGAGALRSNARDMAMFLRACMGLKRSRLDRALSRLVQQRKPTPMMGTETGMGWFMTSDSRDQIVWKSGATSGACSCVAFSPRTHRAAVVLANFQWRAGEGAPVDAGAIGLCMKLIDPGFQVNDFRPLYR